MARHYVELSEVNSSVKVVDGNVVIGTKTVDLYGEKLPDGKVPKWYVVRVDNGNRMRDGVTPFWEFVCGFDLHNKGFWFSGCMINMWKDQKHFSIPSCTVDTWEGIERIFNQMCSDTAGKEWIICLEDEMIERDDEMIAFDENNAG